MNEKVLIIVESPSKAEKIQHFLDNNFIVVASKGHIADLAKGGIHGLGIDFNNHFNPKYVILDDKISIVDSLIQKAKKVDKILVASDPDREGEAIAWHLAQRLADTGKPIKRMVFNEITKSSILKAIDNVRDINMNLFHAQEARRILDRIVGFITSPFLMENFKQTLSAGRVQSVVTRMVIDREREIEAFSPVDFWTINLSVSKDNKFPFLMKFDEPLNDFATAEKMFNVLNSSKKYIVSDVVSSEEKKFPQPPLVTSSLQRIMSKQYGISSDRTMKAAQSLYESGYCSYIRTDSVRSSDEALSSLRDFLSKTYTLPKKPNIFKNKESAQDAHECIRPTDLDLEPSSLSLSPDEKAVYDTIYRFYLASQMLPAVYSTLKVTAHPEDKKSLKIKTSGKALKTPGYLEIFGEQSDEKIEIPNLEKNDELFLFGETPVRLEKKQTQPPARFSEDKLLKELVNKNIGRPATYADLLSKISSRNYVEKNGSVFRATSLGKDVTDVLVENFTFMDFDFTKKMESLLDDIESGKTDKLTVLNNFFIPFNKEINNAYRGKSVGVCAHCGGSLVTRSGKYGPFNVCCDVLCKKIAKK